MGVIKIELDIPNFDKELELKVILNKDGVLSSTPLIDKVMQPSQKMQIPPVANDSGTVWKQQVQIQPSSTPPQPATSSPTTVSKTNHGIPSSMMGNF